MLEQSNNVNAYNALLHVESVVKEFGVHKAVDQVSFKANPGIVGLLGPNGAGKSSLMRMLVGALAPDVGSIYFDGMEPVLSGSRFKRIVGYLPQDFGLYPDVSAWVLLLHLAALKGISPHRNRAEQSELMLRSVNLWEIRHRQLGTYSGGMRQRFGLAQALLGCPRLIVVDEPTAGLDPEERYRLLSLLAARRHEAVILLSTHIVQDIADLGARVLVMNRGRLLADMRPDSAPALLSGKVWRVEVEGKSPSDLAGLQVLHSRLSGGRIVAHCFSDEPPRANAQAVLPSLEDVYFASLLESTGVA